MSKRRRSARRKSKPIKPRFVRSAVRSTSMDSLSDRIVDIAKPGMDWLGDDPPVVPAKFMYLAAALAWNATRVDDADRARAHFERGRATFLGDFPEDDQEELTQVMEQMFARAVRHSRDDQRWVMSVHVVDTGEGHFHVSVIHARSASASAAAEQTV